ncbi:S41 family peptidase [Urechidicola vernalis]|uniref:S41 family peptidase n=1 Tax=Urechidicola vernalis TaxID=3075600 RepID=A0ABU2Y7G0_9FLAO|nr:S41 family peptidase [Urechidicola sp. P050]MDT0554133.1 S41 family peptidase [Urechidicola sp. P050]
MKNTRKILSGIFLVIAVSFSFSYKSDFFEIAKQIEIYTTLFKELNLYYIDEINPAEVMDRAIENTLKDLDPYTTFYDEQGVENARIAAEGEYGGIGASIAFRNGGLIVREVYKDFPAHNAGLIPGDKIVKVDNVILKEHDEQFVRSLLKGLPGSTINVQFERQGELKSLELERETVELNPVPFYDMIDDEVGYISFIKFNRKASQEVKNAFMDLKAQGMKKLIIDVRHNPGGLLGEAVNIVNFFIPKDRVVVTTRAKLDKWSTTFKTKNEPLDLEMPVTIVIDERSASASEILAGALQDYDRAVVVGQRSFGKGLVQRSRKLSYGTQLKLTISKYYTPSGRCIQELDYTNRNLETGEIPKFSDGDVSTFKTTNGRTVYDGGGVTPDVLVEQNELSEASKKLLLSEIPFNYATRYYFKNGKIEPPKTFKLTSQDFNDYQEYVSNNSEEFKLDSEIIFAKSEELFMEENVDAKNELSKLSEKINSQKLALISENETRILKDLENRIVNRFYFKEGEYKHKMLFDDEIKEATALLNNASAYHKILD